MAEEDAPPRAGRSFKGKPHAEPAAADDASNSSSEYQSEDDSAWIPWFCSLKGNEFFCEVDESFARDGFNLTGLNALVPYYDYALDIILDIEPNGGRAGAQTACVRHLCANARHCVPRRRNSVGRPTGNR